MALKLNSTGGGSVTLDAPSTASNVTMTVPATSGGSLVTADSSGNVGIGTSSLNANCRMQVNGRTYMGANDSVYAAGLFYNNTRALAGQGYYIGATDSTTPSLVFSDNNGAERMRIDSSGNLLVGTTSYITSTTPRLNIYSAGAGNGIAISNSDASYASIVTKSLDGGTGTHYVAIFQNVVGDWMGSITHNGYNASFNTSSDYRLKTDVQPMQNALETVSKLKPVTYKWKSTGEDGQGFIAHELQAVVPECVTGEKDAVDAEGNPVYQGIDTSFLVATLTKAIQELSAKNDALEARIAALEAK